MNMFVGDLFQKSSSLAINPEKSDLHLSQCNWIAMSKKIGLYRCYNILNSIFSIRL